MSEKLFKTDEELEKAIDEYFEENIGIDYAEDGTVKSVKAPTVSGLALHLGFADRQSIYDYKGYEENSCTIKKAILRIEQFAENQLFNAKTPTGAIFWLKNHGWYDKQDINHSGQIDSNKKLTREEKKARIAELNKKKGD